MTEERSRVECRDCNNSGFQWEFEYPKGIFVWCAPTRMRKSYEVTRDCPFCTAHFKAIDEGCIDGLITAAKLLEEAPLYMSKSFIAQKLRYLAAERLDTGGKE